MDYNTLLIRLGLDSTNFINKLNEPIRTEKGFIYEVEQRKDKPPCPFCHNDSVYIKGYFIAEINCSETDQILDVLRVKKVRFKCRNCQKTFTPILHGIEPYCKTSNQTLTMIYHEFSRKITFSDIAKRYGLSTARMLQIFDDKIRFVPRRPFPEVLCVDEIKFQTDDTSKYVCILYDFFEGIIVDVIVSRKMVHLDAYFREIGQNERNHVKIVISDMYDAYSTLVRRYFNHAIHIVDMFHVIRLLTNAINTLRVRAMNTIQDKTSAEYYFMKKNWKLFLCRSKNIPPLSYTQKKTSKSFTFDALIFRCLRLTPSLWTGYNTLQDLYRYEAKYTFDEALHFLKRITDNLLQSESPLLQETGRSYHKWRYEIANAFSKTQNNIRYHNGIAETINNHIKSITKAAYGYRNFERFRKRCMLILTYEKPSKKET